MKRIPLAAAFLAATFVAICFFQARGRGIGLAPPLSEWELHPAWWHFNRLADCGDCLVVTPYFFMVLLFVFIGRYLPITIGEGAVEFFAWLSVAFIIAVESWAVFYLIRYLCRRFAEEPNHTAEPSSPSRGGSS